MTTSMQCQWRNTLGLIAGPRAPARLVNVCNQGQRSVSFILSSANLFLFGFHFMSSFFAHSLLLASSRFFLPASFGVSERFVTRHVVHTLFSINFDATFLATITKFLVVKFAFARKVPGKKRSSYCSKNDFFFLFWLELTFYWLDHPSCPWRVSLRDLRENQSYLFCLSEIF